MSPWLGNKGDLSPRYRLKINDYLFIYLPHEEKSLMSPRKTFFVGTQEASARRVRKGHINYNLYLFA